MTHAEQEQQLLTYLQKYRKTINLSEFATGAGVQREKLKFFILEQRGLTPEAVAQVQAYLKQQAQDLQEFNQ